MDNEAESQEQGGTANQIELLKSYLAFAQRAVGRRRVMATVLFLSVVVVACIALAIWPRTYQSDLRLMIQRSAILDPDEKANPLAGASDVITRQENLEELVKQLELVKSWDSTRPPALRLKDRVMEMLRGKPNEESLNDALVTMMESRLWARTEDNKLILGAEWSDPQTAKRIVEAAKESFLQSRHTAEISVIEEKMSILEGHATRLRTEIEGIAQELGRVKEEKLAAAEKAARKVSEAAVATTPPPVRGPAPRRAPAPSASPGAADDGVDLSALKDELATKKRKLGELQARRSQSVLEAKGRLADLKLKYTEDHPEVRSTEQRIGLLAQVSSEETALTGDVDALESQVRRETSKAAVEAASGSSGGRSSGGGAAAVASDTLPSEILKLLDNSSELDPAISAQLSTALSKYSELRGDIRTARITLDTAQAAFNYRYKIVVPATRALRPSKPKVPMTLAMGVLIALALALLVPIGLELKTGVIVERWQVHQMSIPVLGELRLPPRNE